MRMLRWWGPHSAPGEEPVCWNFGPMYIWCKTTQDELWLDYRYSEFDMNSPEEQAVEPEMPASFNWRRWTLKHASEEIYLSPVFPSLPVVAKPEYPFRLMKGVKTKIYVRVPLWLEVKLGKNTILEIPFVVLSKTWFGDFLQGDLCYWVSTAARKQFITDPNRPYLAICPLEIANRSDGELLVEKVALHTAKLSIYDKDGQLWSNCVNIYFEDKESGSDIEVSRKAPAEAADAELITHSRDSDRKGFSARTFATLKEISGLGIFNW